MIKVSSPADMGYKPDSEKLNELLEKFEAKFKDEERGQTYYHLVVTGEYNRKLLDMVQDAYLCNGWDRVKCKTSSENGERPGLTGLILESYL